MRFEVSARRHPYRLSYSVAAPMAEELAEALGVAWRWTGWEERTIWDELFGMARRLWERYAA